MSEYRYQEAIQAANPSISVQEADFVLRALESIDVRVVLEIGTHRGCSARLWRDVLRPELLITVDWEPMLEGQEMNDIDVVSGHRSQDPESYTCVRDLLAGRPIDFLFIDGGHTYDEVKTDFELYGRWVRLGGVVAFHDIYVRNEMHDVCTLWNELEDDPMRDTSCVQGSTGMGVLWVG